MPFLAVSIIVTFLVPAWGDDRRQTNTSSATSVSIEEVDARATISGCMAREASAQNRPQPPSSDPKVRAAVERQARDPQRLAQCRRILSDD